jgi:two-component system, chemotaxis family, protein-glutamate methylesterase/glutaminase
MIAENTNLTCPECRGALKRLHNGTLVQYQCRVGHSYSPRSAVAAHVITEENVLWAAVVALEEAADMSDEVAKVVDTETAEQLNAHARSRRDLAQRIRDIIKDLLAKTDSF